MDGELYESSAEASPVLDVGCFMSEFNDKIYHPWTLKSFIKGKYLSKMPNLQNHLPQVSYDDLLIMLQYKKWQSEEVINSYFDNPDQLLKACGLPFKWQESNNTFDLINNFTCPICCEDYIEPTTVYSLACNHKYCLQCYNSYISNSILSGKLIKCIEPSCALTIPHRDIDRILKVEEPNQLLNSYAKSFINQSTDQFKWCPSTDCVSFTEMIKNYNADDIDEDYESNDISNIPIVSCIERHEFCFNCNFENHLPCPCFVVKLWIKKCQDDSETAHWMDANTHNCPRCETSIEKNGGCNHMTCQKCRHQFCWICLGDWNAHNAGFYTCNKFKDGDTNSKDYEDKKAKESRISLKRYLHFYKRFAIHESSMRGDLLTLKKVHEVTKVYMEDRKNQEKNLSWNDVQFLSDAIRALIIGRKALKWTYCFAFYLKNGNFTEIFESNQDFLSKTVEDLSEIFEKIISKKNRNKVETIMQEKNRIINLSDLIISRKRSLIEGAIVNVNEDLLRFNT
ncbi:hypothetical protein DFJ63DRAFT_319597 [Scheffersomyces coipomensis]|uniref:uncharacterized protein n=1 Tax=Scheffersomyces coipomensis TaxID=1788519 RepID=UPI00315CE0C9